MGVWVNGWSQVKSLKFNKSEPKWDNSILFEDLLFVGTPPAMGGWLVGSMGGSGEITNILINLDIIKIIQFCLKIYHLYRHPHPWVGAWVVGWMGGSVGQWVGSGHITKYRINLDLIKIIQFSVKIYDLLRYPHLWVGVWVNGWVNGWGQVKWLI